MMNILNKYLILCLIFSSCKNINLDNKKIVIEKNIPKTDNIFIDSLKGDFNLDSKMDVIRIEKKESHLIFHLFDNNNSVSLTSNKLIYDIGELKSFGTDFLMLDYGNNILTIDQEYGNARPEGWYKAFISYKKQVYVLDSIRVSSKDWNLEEAKLISKSKIIGKPLFEVDLIKEFEKFNQ